MILDEKNFNEYVQKGQVRGPYKKDTSLTYNKLCDDLADLGYTVWASKGHNLVQVRRKKEENLKKAKEYLDSKNLSYSVEHHPSEGIYQLLIELKPEMLKEEIEEKRCVICDRPLSNYGNNAQPISHGECCDKCNVEVVIPARLKYIKSETALQESNNVSLEDAQKMIDNQIEKFGRVGGGLIDDLDEMGYYLDIYDNSVHYKIQPDQLKEEQSITGSNKSEELYKGYKLFQPAEGDNFFIMDGKDYYGDEYKAKGFESVEAAKAWIDANLTEPGTVTSLQESKDAKSLKEAYETLPDYVLEDIEKIKKLDIGDVEEIFISGKTKLVVVKLSNDRYTTWIKDSEEGDMNLAKNRSLEDTVAGLINIHGLQYPGKETINKVLSEDLEDTRTVIDTENNEIKTYKLDNVEKVGEPTKEEQSIALVEVVNNLINDENEAISGYNSAIVTFAAEGKNDLTDVFRSILEEEQIHIGELQKVLSELDPNFLPNVVDGQVEAEQTLSEDSLNESAEIHITEKEAENLYDKYSECMQILGEN